MFGLLVGLGRVKNVKPTLPSMNFFQFLSHISEFASAKSFITDSWTRFEAVFKTDNPSQNGLLSLCQGKLMEMNQLFS